MDCIAEPAADRSDAVVAPAVAGTTTSAALCVNCEVRSRCVGGVAAEAGTAQLHGILAGRQALLVREVLYEPDDRFVHVYAVRSGALLSAVRREDGERVVGFHFPGELVGVDGMATGRHRVTVRATADTQLCALRFSPRAGNGDSVRAFLSRLWDMMSCELVRERAHQALLATLPVEKRVNAFFASIAGRLRSRGTLRLPPAMGPAEVASYLQVTVGDVQA
ncbi:cyclic nucleotide-binding domain-containing protein [Ramlibacter sp. USB13]|uniref:Cyclic nucleotide-binding domain-containing protein n=1 Tax=Ramlibacter cellulosilyticus TaxID=2764187 RepID=A0A923MPZ8_9BURK|nr:cyclic nucleotide-binding domain-containing protein [Ramlibacter cellulosilyticus]MBC5783098.1 cyclic nucleotide-binding domain-containing protein [Ramlibacter cellulosilyticus]